MEKIGYQPAEAKRFEIADDEFSRARLDVLKRLHAELSGHFPFTIAFSPFGSLTKGKKLNEISAPATDVDLSCFIDIDELNNSYATVLEYDQAFASHYEQVAQEYEQSQSIQDIQHRLKAGLSNSEDATVLENLPASIAWQAMYRYVHQIILNGLNQTKETLGYEPTYDDIAIYPIEQVGEYSIGAIASDLAEITEHTKNGHNPEAEGVKTILKERISRFFHLDLGGKLKPYRQRFIRQLRFMQHDNSAKAENIWQLVNETVREVERQETIPLQIEKQFPTTLDDAARYFL